MMKKLCVALAMVLLFIGMAAAEDRVVARQFILLDRETDDVYLFRGERMLSRAATGMRLIGGDFIITGPKAQAFFQADASKFFQLGPSGSVALTKAEGSSLVMSLKTGEFFFDIRSPLESGETLII